MHTVSAHLELGYQFSGYFKRRPRTMPHTNRKKKTGTTTAKNDDKKPTIVHTKRKEVIDEEGWTHVVDAPSGKAKNASLKTAKLLHGGDFEINGVSYINRTLEEVKTDFEYWKKQWEQSAACEELKKLLAEGESRRKIGNVVFLGMGSLQNSRREGRRASAAQLAALQTLETIFSGGTKLPVILQDPQFTDLDKEFLASLGYAVADDPEAFKLITEDTLVYAIHCYANVYKAVSEGPRPASLIGTDVGNFGRFNL